MSENCPGNNENYERHDDCAESRACPSNTGSKCPAAFETAPKNSIYKELLFIVIGLVTAQGVLLSIKQLVFSNMVETLYSRSMVTMVSMLIIFAIMVLYCRHMNYSFSVFPKSFGIFYIIITLIAVAFYIVTASVVNVFSLRTVIMLFYSSIVTPVFEELLFRGVIWNRLNKHYTKEWKTYIIVTALFAAWHIGYAIGLYLWNGGSLLTVVCMKVLIGGIVGFITGALRYKTKNCYLGIIVHGILNAIG